MAEFLSLFKRGRQERQRLEELATLVATGGWLPMQESDMFREEAGDPVAIRANGKEVLVPLINPEHPYLGRNVQEALRQLSGGKNNFYSLGLIECRFAPMVENKD